MNKDEEEDGGQNGDVDKDKVLNKDEDEDRDWDGDVGKDKVLNKDEEEDGVGMGMWVRIKY